ncbi:MAG: hypothetical protein EXS08_05815 [Planctomycetes bacterium]|nr:hypothetical protein [Planctomycetota bacterium]
MSMSPSASRLFWPTLTSLVLVACGGGSGSSSGPFAPPGTELAKPGGGTFFLDPHRSGQASRVHLPEITWGRLVDVHQLDVLGEVDPLPVFRDMLVNETVQSDATDYRLETNPITQRTRLVVQRRRGEPDAGNGTFELLLARARINLPPVIPHADDGSAAGPFSLVARNACLSLRCDDLLDDGPAAREALRETVRVLSGYPPSQPFVTRILFDPNYGGVVGDEFHSTRVLIDLAVSEEDVGTVPFPLEVNVLGLPPSFAGDERANLSVRLPSRTNPQGGLFTLLTNLAGAPLDRRDDGPVDLDSPTVDIVRGFRSGRADDGNNGFLLDLNKPELIGAWPCTLDAAQADPAGTAGFDLLLDLTFVGTCRRALNPADILQVGELFLEVRQASAEPSSAGVVLDARARVLGDEPLGNPAILRGAALYLSTYAPGLTLPSGCWVSVVPPPAEPPSAGLGSDSQFQVRFSEPMNPASVDPFETLLLARGDSSTPVVATNLVVSEAVGSGDLRLFTLRPLLPLAQGVSGEYHLDLAAGVNGLSDLAGNLLVGTPGALDFVLAPDEVAPPSGGVVMRFASTDELEPIGFNDLRGQFFYDLANGKIHGRSVVFESFPADSSQPVPGIMIPFAPGVQTPLSGLGSKLQYVWRYADLGWQVEDESKHNLDVVGLAWTPVGGNALSDFFERFEIRLGHSRRLPDEFRTFTGTFFPCSGLGAGSNVCPPCLTNIPFEDNFLFDARNSPRIVHERSLGYRIDPRDLFVDDSGALRMPYPLNRGSGPFQSYTWRDTAVLSKDGLDSAGIPLKVEVSDPLMIVPGPAGRIAPPGKVPAWGLPLLVEVHCFPSNSAIGLNPLEIYLAQNSQALPNFRAYSTGGINQGGVAVQIDPDLAVFPEGGYNPGSRPPGQGTLFQADNSFYTGVLGTVVRLSRAHTIWIPALVANPSYLPPVVSPRVDEQPGNARVELEFRGATGFTGQALTSAFDARRLDPLGDVLDANDAVDEFGVQFWHDDPTWTNDVSRLDGAPFVQIRMTFVNDLAALVSPELSALGIAYSGQ